MLRFAKLTIHCDLIKCVSLFFLVFFLFVSNPYIKCVCSDVSTSHKTHVFPATGFCSCCANFAIAAATTVYATLGLCMLYANCTFIHTVFVCARARAKHRRLADEDDELSEVQPDAVPPEVREWLASTFTRQLVTTRKRTEEKPKFRTVAHAIRAGIFVDRIYRRVSSTAMLQFPPEVVKVLKVKNLLNIEYMYTYKLRYKQKKTIHIIYKS